VPRLTDPLPLRRLVLPNRVIRAATFENMADAAGHPTARLTALYRRLAEGGVRTIITGFIHPSRTGRAMQPFQAGLAHEGQIESWRKVIAPLKAECPDLRVIAQIAHAGRQTLSRATGGLVRGAGPVRCEYFRARVVPFTTAEVEEVIDEFAHAIRRAALAGFDAVQMHAAHGYLIHQFLSPHTNQRTDAFGADRMLFLRRLTERTRSLTDLPLLLKISAADDRRRGLSLPLMLSYWPALDALQFEAIEVSYGMMEIAFNIIRGGHPLDPVLTHNPLFNRYDPWIRRLFKRFVFPLYRRRFLPYVDLYNLENACRIKAASKTPILVTGGVRTRGQIDEILEKKGLDGVTLCRPLVCEPDLLKRLTADPAAGSRCTSCNLCTVMCDSRRPLQCYQPASGMTGP
jgi:2,4-dienoyl-CoA reductase-like NADH-dependent reductase (Old Yellow Enzyme family)